MYKIKVKKVPGDKSTEKYRKCRETKVQKRTESRDFVRQNGTEVTAINLLI
jgi:hypothetical protein